MKCSLYKSVPSVLFYPKPQYQKQEPRRGKKSDLENPTPQILCPPIQCAMPDTNNLMVPVTICLGTIKASFLKLPVPNPFILLTLDKDLQFPTSPTVSAFSFLSPNVV